MLSTTVKIAVLTGVAGAVLTVTGAAAQAQAPAAPAAPKGHGTAARVTGEAQFRLTFSPDQDVRAFTIDAQGAPYSRPMEGAPHGLPTDARGTVKIYHHSPQAGVTVLAEAAVDCLVTAPGGASLTAVVTKANEPVKDMLGKRIGISVQDGRPARVGFSWAVVNATQSGGEWRAAEVGTCMAPAAFAPVTKGGYKVRHADLLPVPSAG